MIKFQVTSSLLLAIACGFDARTSSAFTTTSRSQRLEVNRMIGYVQYGRHSKQKIRMSIRSLNVLNSSPDPNTSDEEFEENYDLDGGASMSSSQQQQQPETPVAYVPPPPSPTRNSPQVVRQQRMDPLMASLTRDNSDISPDQPTQNVPIFGEIPADGTLLLLGPAVLFAVLGFVYSIVIAFNSSDRIVDSLMQAGDSVAQSAVNRNNRVYDKNVCRGLCSSQQDDIDGMRNFMEAITRNAREGD